MVVSNVNFNLYKSFIAAYEAKNISKAAAALQITQPTVTYNIKELERQLGVKLFHTHPRGVEPTKDAHELYKFVSVGMNSIVNGESAIKEFNEDSVTTIRIATGCGLAGTYLARPIAMFVKKYPNVTFEITENNGSEEVVSRLVQHNTDLVVKVGGTDISSVGAVEIAELKKIAVAGADFAKENGLKDKISAKDIGQFPLILFESARNYITPFKPLVVASDARAMMALVKENIGVGICFEEHKNDIKADEAIVLDVEDLDVKEKINVLYNKDSAGKATKAFVDIIAKVYSK
ncbi:MAG: LysR family transcriptional regulator [Firmicutes bacterium]|nr:LysR family transcriptional regulator [Bacillota bacterium]